MSAALMGSSIGLGLGVTYLLAGLGSATADHFRTARIAQESRGTLSETMLQRNVSRSDPAAAAVARNHDGLTNGFGARAPLGQRNSAVKAKRDLECLTDAVYFEARGETPRGQAAVAQVVLNRLANPNFPKTVCGVVFQGARHPGCQFSFACDGSMHRGLEMAAWDRARRVAEQALAGVRSASIGNATHFHTVDVQPYWGPSMLRVAQVGLHIFYRRNPHAPAMQAGEVEEAVFTSLPSAAGSGIRLASAVAGKGADGMPAASSPSSEAAKAGAEPAASQPAEAISHTASAEPAAS
ncbi:MAG: cell wall hydrolase [Phenylobacterium sp.]